MSDFQFLRPQFLLLFIPFFLLFFFYLRGNQFSSIWSKTCSQDLLPYILAKKGKRFWFPYILIALAASLLITALAGPSWESRQEPLLKSHAGLIIALDLSKEMDAQDLKPSRLHRAIFKIRDLLKMHREGQTGLIVFSKDSFVVTPLTEDVEAIKALLPALESSIMPSAGHQADKAITKAIELFQQAGLPNGSILLITASLSSQEMEKSIELATKAGLSISVLGIGTEEGAPIPQQEGDFLKDDNGTLILTTLSKENLSQLAKATHGSYTTLSLDDSDLSNLVNQFAAHDHSPVHEDLGEKQNNRRHDQGYLLVLLALPLVSLFFRKGMLGLLLLFLLPHSLQAFSWDDLWKTADQQGENYYHNQEYQKAKELFQDRDWLASTHYKLGDYNKAAALFKESTTADGWYNYGTAQAKLGNFEDALNAYAKTLEIEPHHEDALYNKKLIEDLKKEQNEQKQDQSKDKQNQPQEQNQSKDNQNQQQDQEGEKSQEQTQEENQESQQEQQKDGKSNEELKEKFKEEMDQKVEEQDKQEKEAGQSQKDSSSEEEEDPQQQVDERWLQKVKDDPGGLLRRKFLLQYRQSQGQ